MARVAAEIGKFTPVSSLVRLYFWLKSIEIQTRVTAHGKRSSEGGRTSQYRQIREEGNGRAVVEDEADGKPAVTSDQNRSLFSRLITGRLAVPAAGPIVGKRPSNRWHQKQSVRSLPENWEINYGTNTNEIIRYDAILYFLSRYIWTVMRA